MENIATQLNTAIFLLQQNLPFILAIIGILYAIHIVNWILGYRLVILGIYPRKFLGMFGIIFSPFIHGHFNHLFFNSIPLFILASFVLLNGFDTFYIVSAIIILLSGFGVWLIARKGFHVGASGVIMGYWGYLLVNAYYHPTILSIVLAIICVWYFGGLMFHLFPQEVKSSFEAHICGFLSGVLAAYVTPTILGWF